MYNLHNHDPLSYATLQEGDVIQKSVKRGIRNIIKSYTGYYDIFSELISKIFHISKTNIGTFPH